MTQVFAVVLEEGEYSGRDWRIIAICSSLDNALACVSALDAKRFVEEESCTWEQYPSPYMIQPYNLDHPKPEPAMDEESDNIYAERVETRRRHPEMEPVIHERAEKARKKAAKETARWTLGPELLKQKEHLDEQMRKHNMTTWDHGAAVSDLYRKHQEGLK